MIRKVTETTVCIMSAFAAAMITALAFRIILPDVPPGQDERWTDYIGGIVALAAEICVALAVFWCCSKRFRARVEHHRSKEGLCLKCGYDLTGNVSGTCPECGAEVKQA
jgi:hypothetical protein